MVLLWEVFMVLATGGLKDGRIVPRHPAGKGVFIDQCPVFVFLVSFGGTF